MTYDQVRNAFLLGSTVAEKAASFAAERVDQLSAGQPIKPMSQEAQMVVHLIPFQGIAGRFTVSIPSTRLDAELTPVFVGGCISRPNLQGMAFYQFEEQGLVEQYLQVFRNGCVEHVENLEWSSNGLHSYLVAEKAARSVVDALSAYKNIAKTWEIGGPVLVTAATLHTSHVDLIYRERTVLKSQPPHPRIGLGEQVIEDISMDIDADAISQSFMDVLFQAFGAIKCPLYDETGRLKVSSSR